MTRFLSAPRPRAGFRLAAWAAGLLVLLTGCARDTVRSHPASTAPSSEAAHRQAVRVDVTTVQSTAFEDAITVNGVVEAQGDVHLSAAGPGMVAELAPLGRMVNAGEVVVRLDDTVSQALRDQAVATLSAAEAQQDLAEATYRRKEALYRDSVISAMEFETVRAQRDQAVAHVRQARARLIQAEKQLADTRLIAPFRGTVEAHHVKPGEQVLPGAPVARIVHTAAVTVRAGVPERYAGQVVEGSPVSVHALTHGTTVDAVVRFAGRTVHPENRTFPVEVDLPNPDQRLKPEMVVRLRVVRAVHSDAIVIPLAAVVRDADGPVVYVAAEAEHALVAERRGVALGPASNEQVVVTAGLDAGDRVVVRGQNHLAAGDMLHVVGRRF